MFDLIRVLRKHMEQILTSLIGNYTKLGGSFNVKVDKEKEVFITAILADSSYRLRIKTVRHLVVAKGGFKTTKRAYYLMSATMSGECQNEAIRIAAEKPVCIPTCYKQWRAPSKHLEIALIEYIDFLKCRTVK